MTANQLEDFKKIVSENRALAILRTLQREVSYGSNERVMGTWLETLALGGGREVVRADLERLEKLLVINCEKRGEDGNLIVFRLTQRGLDYLEGRVAIEGLARIEPDCPY